MNVNKIPFRSTCAAHAIFSGGSSFIHRSIDRLAYGFALMQGRHNIQFQFSKHHIHRWIRRNGKLNLEKRSKKTMDYLTRVCMFFSSQCSLIPNRKFSVPMHLIVVYPPYWIPHHHIATHSRLINQPPFTRNTILFTIY